MAKTKPFSVRFDKEELDFAMKHTGKDSPYELINFLLSAYRELYGGEKAVTFFDKKEWWITSEGVFYNEEDYLRSVANIAAAEEAKLMTDQIFSINDILQALRNIFEKTGEFKPSPGAISMELKEIAKLKINK